MQRVENKFRTVDKSYVVLMIQEPLTSSDIVTVVSIFFKDICFVPLERFENKNKTLKNISFGFLPKN